MVDASTGDRRVELTVENIGGIERASLEIRPGVTALVGENATNRTSLVQAIAAGLGTDEYALKSDSQEGQVTLSVGEETYTRRLNREQGGVRSDGSPYLENPTLAELYAVLLRSNEIRQAVRDGNSLRDLILEPADTAEIERQITDLVDQRRDVDAELDRIEQTADRLATARAEREQRRQTLEELQARLEDKRTQLAAADTEATSADAQSEFDSKLADLSEARSALQRVQTNVENERQRLESLRESYETVAEQRHQLSEPDEAELARLEERRRQLRDRKRQLETTVSELRQVIRFNSDRLSESQPLLSDTLGEADSRPVVDDLDPHSSTVTCWTCGSTVEQSRIEMTLDELKALRGEKVTDRTDTERRIADVQDELDRLTSRREECESLDSKLREFETRIEEIERAVEVFEDRADQLRDRIGTLEATVDSLRGATQDEFLTLRQQVSELTVETERAEETLEDKRTEIASLEADVAERERLERRRETISDDLRELRTRIERIESEAVEQFNTHMAALVDRLGYDNIDRLWMERRGTDTAGSASTAEFELHVVRESAAGEAYEDELRHLSESERELVGLVVALAGYLVHDVHETVPFMLLDSVEMVDGNRLVELVTYLEEYVPFLVVVLLPDHAVAFEKQSTGANFRAVHV